MVSEGSARSLRVEQALRLLPDTEALAPLRALLIATSRPDEESVWASSGPYLTVGKRRVQPEELRRQVPQLLRRISDHVAVLYAAVVEALEMQERGEGLGTVRALLKGGEREESTSRFGQASAWYEVALELSEGLRERQAEIETLLRLGRVSMHLGRYEEGGRYHQRAFVLAEAEFDPSATILAAQGLGEIALAQGAYGGAESWYARGLSLAEAASDAPRVAQLHRRLGDVARRKGDLESARARLRQAREILARLADWKELARTWNGEGQLEVELARYEDARVAYRKALEALGRMEEGDPSLEASIRADLADLYVRMDRFLEAEDELRRAEETAIAHNLARRLIRVYSLMGKLAARQGDETGFVFFEKALELCRASGEAPLLEGQVYFEYGAFRAQLGEREEARAHLERARQILEPLGDVPELGQVRIELERLSGGDGSGAGDRGRRTPAT